MALKLTENVKQTAEKHKKALEKYEFIPHAAKQNNLLYYAVRYIRFKKEKGLLIVSQTGQAVSREEAFPLCELIIHYYSAVNFREQMLVTLIERPVWQFEEMLELLDTLSEHLNTVQEDVEQLKAVLQSLLDDQQKLKDIDRQMKAVEAQVQEKGFVTSEHVRTMRMHLKETKKIQYNGARKQLSGLDHVQRIKAEIQPKAQAEKNSKSSKLSRLDELLQAYSHKLVLRKLKQNMRRFEITPEGKHVTFAAGEKGLKEMLANFDQLSDQKMHAHVFPLLRN